jgi:hypothetical protein
MNGSVWRELGLDMGLGLGLGGRGEWNECERNSEHGDAHEEGIYRLGMGVPIASLSILTQRCQSYPPRTYQEDTSKSYPYTGKWCSWWEQYKAATSGGFCTNVSRIAC